MDALRTLEILITSRTPFIAIATRPLSVTRAEEIDALREWAKGRTVPAS